MTAGRCQSLLWDKRIHLIGGRLHALISGLRSDQEGRRKEWATKLCLKTHLLVKWGLDSRQGSPNCRVGWGSLIRELWSQLRLKHLECQPLRWRLCQGSCQHFARLLVDQGHSSQSLHRRSVETRTLPTWSWKQRSPPKSSCHCLTQRGLSTCQLISKWSVPPIESAWLILELPVSYALSVVSLFILYLYFES